MSVDVLAPPYVTTDPRIWLDWPGVVVSGHPDRHVRRVRLPDGGTGYLKVEHRVPWRDRFWNALAGFGPVAKSLREACVLRRLEREDLPGPRCLAAGEQAGRAFVLVAALADSCELPTLWPTLSPTDRRALAQRVGAAIGRLHTAGFFNPDLQAKHVLVGDEIALLDWQRAAFVSPSPERSARLLQRFATTLPHDPSLSERLAFLHGYEAAGGHLCWHTLAHPVPERRTLPVPALPQELVWLDGEAICATPEAAEQLGRRQLASFGYGTHSAIGLTRQSGANIAARLGAWLRGRPWRSAHVIAAGVLFHLARHGLPVPRLQAFGQRQTWRRAEAFLLVEPVVGVPVRTALRRAPMLRACVAEFLTGLHAAGCCLRHPLAAEALVVCDGAVTLADPHAVTKRRLRPADRERDFVWLEGAA